MRHLIYNLHTMEELDFIVFKEGVICDMMLYPSIMLAIFVVFIVF